MVGLGKDDRKNSIGGEELYTHGSVGVNTDGRVMRLVMAGVGPEGNRSFVPLKFVEGRNQSRPGNGAGKLRSCGESRSCLVPRLSGLLALIRTCGDTPGEKFIFLRV